MIKVNVDNRTIFCNDNLSVLRGINSNCIDLIYLDPPFNKKKQFFAPIGSEAEGAEFKDYFGKVDIKEEWLGLIADEYPLLAEYIQGIGNIGHKSNKYYLCYMAIRLIEMHRILKETGSLYLHCDQTMSHYLKLLLDCIFGEDKFRNEIIWCYHGPGSPGMRQFNRKSDSIFWYSHGDNWTFNANDVRIPYKDPKQSLRRAFSTSGDFTEDEVNVYRQRGKVPENWWEMRIAPRSRKEYVGYPTQKPIALLERIIKASSSKGDMVLDPFCGCATTCVAAERLERQWMGIDISRKAWDLVNLRIKKEVPEDLFRGKADLQTTLPKRTDKGQTMPDKNISKKDKKRILYGRQHGYCNGCEYPFQFKNLTVDHIVADGNDDLDNLQLLCNFCNSAKGKYKDMPALRARLRADDLINDRRDKYER